MWGWIRITKNCSAMHRGIALHLFNEEIPTSSLPSLYRFTTWLLVLLVASSSSLSLQDVHSSFFSLYSQSAAYHDSASFLPPPSLFSLFISCLQLFPFMLSFPQLRRKSLIIGSSAVAQPSLNLSHLISCIWLGMWCGWLLNQIFSIVWSHFLSLGLLMCSLFSEAKDWLYFVSLITHLVEFIAGMREM